MPDDTVQVAKATQEIAKTVGQGIEATERAGSWLAKILGEPIEVGVGILADRLKFKRWQFQLALMDRVSEIAKSRKLTSFRAVPPKLALPIIENASSEEDETLRDLWANLLAAAIDPSFDGLVRTAFIEIIRQMEPIDAKMLRLIYAKFDATGGIVGRVSKLMEKEIWSSPISWSISAYELRTSLDLGPRDYEACIDNLIRMRCVAPFVSAEQFTTLDTGDSQLKQTTVSTVHNYEKVCMTAFGALFVEACMPKTA